MSLLLVTALGVVVYLYMRATKLARRDWLTRIALPGRWHGEENANQGDVWSLALRGGVDGGDFVLAEGEQETRGQWQIVGHTLTLRNAGKAQSFDLHYFKTGSIGLEDDAGRRRILTKVADNVVPLRSRSRD